MKRALTAGNLIMASPDTRWRRLERWIEFRGDRQRGIAPLVHMRKLLIAGATAALVASISACGGSDSTPNPYLTGLRALPNIPTQKTTSSVMLPTGSTVRPEQLTVMSMIDQTVPAANGQFSISSSDSGSQIAIVLSPKGNPMLLGWIDAKHANVSATTTAEVLVYFGLGGYLIDGQVDRDTLIQLIPSAPGFGGLVGTINTVIAANPDATATSNATVTTALTAVVGPLLAGASVESASSTVTKAAARSSAQTLTPQRLRQLLTPQAVSVQDGRKSGLEVQGDDPLSAHVVNYTRRRTWAFVNPVSDTINKVEVGIPDPVEVTNFEVGPEVGLNNGFAGTISDIMNYEFGNTTAAYAPVTAPDTPFAMTLHSGASASTYQVTIVGPGVGVKQAKASLPANQAKQLGDTAIKGLLVDAFLPFVVNAVFGAHFASSPDLAASPKEFILGLAKNLAADTVNLLATSPALYDKVMAGDSLGATNDFWTAYHNSNTNQQFIVTLVQQAGLVLESLGTKAGSGTLTGFGAGLTTALSKFNQIAAGFGVALQSIDTVLYSKDIVSSNAVETFSVKVAPANVTINPLTSSIIVGKSVAITASLPGVTDLTPYSFLWMTTGLAGTFTGANASQTGVTSYCTSSSSTTYQSSADTIFPSGANSLQDQVSVQVFQGTGVTPCTTGVLIAATTGDGSSLPATIVVTKNTITISPENPILTPGQTVPITAQTAAGTANDSPPNFTWSLQANPNGSLSATTGSTIIYTAGVSGPDVLSVRASDPVSGKDVGSGTSTITVKEPSGLTFTASSGSACCGGIDPGTYTTSVVPTGSYGNFCADYECSSVYGFSVSWPVGGNLRLALEPGGTITGTQSWGTYESILDTIQPGQFLFISSTSDNLGDVTITTVTPLPSNELLATFTFTEGSTSGSSTRTYQGAGSFIIPAPPTTSP